MLEVERLHSHLLNIGLASHYTGFDSGFQQFFRVREKSMDWPRSSPVTARPTAST